MAVELEAIPVETGGHLVQFYEDDAQLAQTVGGYLVRAVQDAAVAVVIATESHRRLFIDELTSAGVDVAGCLRDGTLILLDAAATMAQFVDRGQVDHEAFRRVVGQLLLRAGAGGRPVCAYGEMVALLWDAGDVLAAIELEKAWNQLARNLHTCVIGRPPGEHRDPALEDAETAVPEAVCATFPGGPEAPATARRFVADLLRRGGHSAALLEDAKLVVSELATNAVIHARSSFTVEVRPRGTRLRLSVRDASRAKPELGDDDPLAASGRGLRLVDTLAAAWGVELAEDGKTVWAELRA
jgi:anti-sigma regulatory factor (Ser/Thr protein kinase)